MLSQWGMEYMYSKIPYIMLLLTRNSHNCHFSSKTSIIPKEETDGNMINPTFQFIVIDVNVLICLLLIMCFKE